MEVFERVGEEAKAEDSAEREWREESKSADDGDDSYQDRGVMGQSVVARTCLC